jgi:hypothetical protein
VLDAGLPDDWPDGVKDACRRLQMGDVLELRPLFYFADTRRPVWVLARAQAEEESEAGDEPGTGVVELSVGSAQSPDFVILTSQTCDIGEEAEVWEFPWVQVAPVYRVAEGDQILQRDYLVPLNGPHFEGQFAADLRLDFPIEKGALVDVVAHPGFATEEDAIRFAETVGRRRQRAAVASQVNRCIRATMRAKVNARRPAWRAIRNDVHKIMLAIEEGSRLEPRLVRLVVISKDPLSPEARAWFDGWHTEARDAAYEAGLVLAPNRYMDRRNFDVVDYDRLIELNKNF